MTIQALLFYGFVAGLVTGWVIAKPMLGCLTLLAVPIVMIAYVIWWQGQNPEQLRSTSALDFIFGPLWPSLGAIVGFPVARLFKAIITKP